MTIKGVIKRTFLILFIFAVIVMTTFIIFASAEGTLYIVTAAEGAELYEKPQKDSVITARARKDTVLNVTKTVGSFGFTEYEGAEGYIDLSFGVKLFEDEENEDEKNVKSITVKTLPKKLTYIDGEEKASTDGLVIRVTYKDGTEKDIETGFTVLFPSLDTYGEKKVTVLFGSARTQYSITVKKAPLSYIMVTPPTKTSYRENEPISFDGLVVRAFYSDGRLEGNGRELSRDEIEITGVRDGQKDLKTGEYTVTVTYKYPEISSSFHIFVNPRKVVRLTVKALPENLSLYQGQRFDLEKFSVEAVYDNGETENVKNFDLIYDNMTPGEKTAVIRYKDREAVFRYVVFPLVKTGIVADTGLGVGGYTGSPPDFSSLSVFVVYNSGERKRTDDYELIYDIDIERPGTYPVKVRHQGFETSFIYTLKKKKTVLAGDVNFDGVITAEDARIVLRYSARLEMLDELAVLAADIDADGVVTAGDARQILRISAGL